MLFTDQSKSTKSFTHKYLYHIHVHVHVHVYGIGYLPWILRKIFCCMVCTACTCITLHIYSQDKSSFISSQNDRVLELETALNQARKKAEEARAALAVADKHKHV